MHINAFDVQNRIRKKNKGQEVFLLINKSLCIHIATFHHCSSIRNDEAGLSNNTTTNNNTQTQTQTHAQSIRIEMRKVFQIFPLA